MCGHGLCSANMMDHLYRTQSQPDSPYIIVNLSSDLYSRDFGQIRMKELRGHVSAKELIIYPCMPRARIGE